MISIAQSSPVSRRVMGRCRVALVFTPPPLPPRPGPPAFLRPAGCWACGFSQRRARGPPAHDDAAVARICSSTQVSFRTAC